MQRNKNKCKEMLIGVDDKLFNAQTTGNPGRCFQKWSKRYRKECLPEKRTNRRGISRIKREENFIQNAKPKRHLLVTVSNFNSQERSLRWCTPAIPALWQAGTGVQVQAQPGKLSKIWFQTRQ